MNFTLTTLGTASAMPRVDRNQSAQVLQVHGRLFLIDCGENTQRRIREEGLSFAKIEAVFISHLHGDHVFGLLGLISTMGLYGRVEPLRIFGPAALEAMLVFFKKYFGDGLPFQLEFTEVKASSPVTVYENRYVRVSAFPLNHKIETYGYRFDAVPTPKNPEGAHQPSYAYVSDTAPFEELPSYVQGVDVLYHESTYTAEFEQQALKRFHSTSKHAAQCALDAGAGTLILGHYSARCRDLQAFENEARTIFPNVFAATDGDVFEIPQK